MFPSLQLSWALLLALPASPAPAGEASPEGRAGQVVLTELCAANQNTTFDEDGRSSDWVELTNVGEGPLSLDNYGLSDDRARPGKWRFPHVVLAPRASLVVWASGKDRRQLSEKTLRKTRDAIPFQRKLISAGENWRYLVPPAPVGFLPERWTLPDFDDGMFAEGPSGFGYEDNDDATPLPPGTTIVLVRKRFELDDPSLEGQLLLGLNFDDGFVAYLNGARVASANAPRELSMASTATAKHEAGQGERFDLSAHAHLLRKGTNVLAIAGLNTQPSEDMSLIPELGTVPFVLHTSFELAAEGGVLVLTDPSGAVVDSVEYPRQALDRSYGKAQGEATWAHFATPTPGAPNIYRAFGELPTAVISLVPGAGYFTDRIAIKVAATPALPGLALHFTTDGSIPTTRRRAVEGEIRFARTDVLRVAGYIGDELVTPVATGTYLRGTPAGALPVLSLVLPRSDFNTIHASENGHGFRFERPAHLEIFDATGELKVSTDVGFRLHGGFGRRGDLATKKSYRLYFRPRHGMEKLEYPLLPGVEPRRIRHLVLRSNFNDRLGGYHPGSAFLRDELLRKLHRDLGAAAAGGTWCRLLVNGAPRGLYNAVERINKDFLVRKLGGKTWDLIKTGDTLVAGSRDDWDALHQFTQTADGSLPATHERLEAWVDVPAFTSYVILNLWAQNEDWPQNNWYAARDKAEGGKWRFFQWDGEWGLGHTPAGYQAESFSGFFSRSSCATSLLSCLWHNEEYRNYFLAEVERLVAGPLGPEQVLKRIDEEAAIVEPYIAEELSVNAPGFTVAQWKKNVAQLRDFAEHRGPIFLANTRRAVARGAALTRKPAAKAR